MRRRFEHKLAEGNAVISAGRILTRDAKAVVGPTAPKEKKQCPQASAKVLGQAREM